jgi:hypothetical protein
VHHLDLALDGGELLADKAVAANHVVDLLLVGRGRAQDDANAGVLAPDVPGLCVTVAPAGGGGHDRVALHSLQKLSGEVRLACGSDASLALSG